MAGPRLVTTAVVLLLCRGTRQAHAQAPTVSITFTNENPPGVTPVGPNEYRAASGSYTFTCTATGGAGSGDYDYEWTSTCESPCAFETTSTGATSAITRETLHSGDGGIHTCTASRTGGQSASGSDSINVTIVGVGILNIGGPSGLNFQPNNGLIISNSGSGTRFRFFCRSNSLTIGVGELIGLDGRNITASNFFQFQTPVNGGELRVINTGSQSMLLPASEQGVYTCRMPFEGDGEGEINIGLYPSGFNTVPTITNPLEFTPGSSSSTLTCTSTGSVATTVTFMKDSTTVGPLRDGESTDDEIYQLAQTVTSRAESTYQNVLTINQPLADIVGSTFTCSVENTIGTSPASQPLTINAIGITSIPETLTVGDTATFTCTSLLGQADTIEWFIVDGSEMSAGMNSGQTSLELALGPVSESMNGRVYRCRVTISGATVDQDVTVTVQVPEVSVMTSFSGSAVAGDQYSIICAVIGADTLDASPRIEWSRGGNTIIIGTQSPLTHPFTPLGQSDAGEYTCEAVITNDLLLDSPITVSDTLTITVAVPVVTVVITTSGSAEVGMSYTLTCAVSGADNLEEAISIEFTGPAPNSVSGTGTSLQLPLTLDLNDAGRYTCTATVSSGLITSDIVSSDIEDITLQIPSLTVGVELGGGTIYSGSVLTLTCEISLIGSVPSSLRSGVTVTTAWLGASGNLLSTGDVITVNPAMGSGATYSSTLVINPVRTNNDGTYTCQATATHSSSFITAVTSPGQVTFSVVLPTLELTVDSDTTRLPNMSPYNTFTLTCTATAPTGVIESKTFTWRRRSGSGGSCGSFSAITEGGIFQITDSDVDQPVSTSVLTVTETTAAEWRYCCQASLFDVTYTSDEVAVTVTGPTPPQQPTNLMNIDTRAMSSMIQWTVPMIAYTPETYVVHYGTSMSSLNVMSDLVESENDFEAVDQVRSVELTGLVNSTTYFYLVEATNGQGSTSSVIESFTTTILRSGPPQHFILTMSMNISLSFSWDPPAPIENVDAPTRYIVRCDPQLDEIGTPALVNQSALQETATVTDLFPGVTYDCSVTAMNNRGEGDPAEQSGTTQERAPTGEPQNFGITPGNDGPTSRELTFSWDLPLPTQRNGIITSYTISCSPDTETLPLVETTLPGEGGLTVGGFRPFTEYTCVIVAHNSQGSGPPTANMAMTSQDAPSGPPQSSSFTTTENPMRLMFTVQPPQAGMANGQIVSYRVRCIPSNAFPSANDVTETISSAGEVGDFTLAADYLCFFTASTRVGPSPETTAGLDVTTLPDTPTITSVTNRSTSEVLVEWTITVPETTGPGAITHFTVYVDNSAVVNTANGMASSYVIRNLAPFQLVMVQVSASTSAGEGARSEAVDGRSSEASPGPVSNVLWEPQSASSVTVSWSPPLMPNGVILKYSVVLERYEGGPIIDSRNLDGNVFTTMFTDNQALVAEVPYNVTVTARNSVGEGDPVEIVDFTEESNSPPFPNNVSILRSSDGREMIVSWTPLTLVEAKSLIQFYRVTYDDPVRGSRKRQSGTTCSQSPCDVPGTESSVLITGLDPSTSYVVQVAVVNGGGQRGPSAVVIADIPTTSGTDTAISSGTDTAAIVGGVVAVVGLLIIIAGAVLIVFLVLRNRSSLSVEKHAESVKWSEVAKSGDPDIKTTECIAYSPVTHLPQDTEYEIPTESCAAYGQSQQISPRVQEEAVYEVIPGEENLPPTQI